MSSFIDVKELKYEINVGDLKMVHEMIKKQKQLKVIITNEYHMIFVYNKQEIFTCELQMHKWVRCNHKKIDKVAKIQHQEHESIRMHENGRRNENGRMRMN